MWGKPQSYFFKNPLKWKLPYAMPLCGFWSYEDSIHFLEHIQALGLLADLVNSANWPVSEFPLSQVGFQWFGELVFHKGVFRLFPQTDVVSQPSQSQHTESPRISKPSFPGTLRGYLELFPHSIRIPRMPTPALVLLQVSSSGQASPGDSTPAWVSRRHSLVSSLNPSAADTAPFQGLSPCSSPALLLSHPVTSLHLCFPICKIGYPF